MNCTYLNDRVNGSDVKIFDEPNRNDSAFDCASWHLRFSKEGKARKRSLILSYKIFSKDYLTIFGAYSFLSLETVPSLCVKGISYQLSTFSSVSGPFLYFISNINIILT